MKVALIQSPLIWEDPNANRKAFESKMALLPNNVDLVILPEMFTTGFTMSPEHIDASEGLQTVKWMQSMARELQIAIAGSIVFKEEGKYYNRLYFVEPHGGFTTYDKRHTFTLAGEHKKYESGEKKVIVHYKGFRFCPLICYDLRFPVWARNTEDYDVLIYVANWPKPRISAWDTLLQARAIENMAYCLGVNRVGFDELGHEYPGHSSAYDVLGNQLALSTGEEILYVTLDKEHIDKNREKLQFLEDQDDFNLL
ncbi:amidohydrolase [Flagellimonas meridianipacifica]|uniref:Omega-amidase YafV n=1 Tax=Flagellimonas meridianipacifica TaxID=1080225 RepID=A0A2T0MGF5_9FLAO|nr:amidohydrolase [Allomuricauda pacifica]PRX56668.1 putative amidohydrolase [Allomuricauda pacifica]